ncbi:MAG TPA: hypothetical protein PLF88_04215 [Opitutaceae bacterium]|nr:hypothetical protein [Opitutaceae bacterium]HRJ47464.1 hypothetical protein [Opitutaceae bacterium]
MPPREPSALSAAIARFPDTESAAWRREIAGCRTLAAALGVCYRLLLTLEKRADLPAETDRPKHYPFRSFAGD